MEVAKREQAGCQESYQFRLHRSGWGVVRWESSVGECGIIDRDSIVSMQPETRSGV
jgi:hypothetical protein